ncbi:concanavalin A-like lectin/glucanase domain-containing protein [Massariosphaeria phaeospora]|uniref:chitinase n=1 Tax=Massariosphaeria phaeospora TaxID=100035 RepID=A0A7C8MJD1_9PLEO|nr:concanavalin A-like lectin/glucanase domain-containing protein [Massariosphaeria phaeospora]
MRSFAVCTAAVVSVLLSTTLAQTFTACNYREKKGCPNNPALGGNATFNFNATMNEQIWRKKNQGLTEKGLEGTTFTIERSGDSPKMDSTFYMLFGRVEVVMRAANGTGIVSSIMLQSESLDEIDWEFLGDQDEAMTAYFGRGDREKSDGYTPGEEFPMKSPQADFHNYTLDWTKERIQWWLDDKMVRELKYEDAKGGKRYPQTPMNVRIGPWAGGDKDNNAPGVVEWAKGETDFSKGPFSMTVKTVYVEDYTKNAKEYSFADMDDSGDWRKVKVIEGESEALAQVNNKTTKDRWNGLSHGAKIGIAAGVLGFVVIAALIGLLYFFRQRRQGRKEWAAQQAQQDKEASELLQFQQGQRSGKFGYNRV